MNYLIARTARCITLVLCSLASIGYAVSNASTEKEKEAEGDTRVKLSVQLQHQKPRNYLLSITLVNESNRSLIINEYSLPWGNRYSLLLVAIEADRFERVLDQPRYIDDPQPGKVVMKPSQQLQGTISLNSRFPGLSKELESGQFIIFWTYRLKPLNAPATKRLAGWLVIPKSEKEGEPKKS